MEILEFLHLSEVLHEVSAVLLIPTVIILLLFIVYTLYSIGSIVIEAFFERRKYRVAIPELVARLDSADPADFSATVEGSGLLRSQKDDLQELIAYLYLNEEARIGVAQRLLTNANDEYQVIIGKTDIASRVAPMLGLMGTLIPLGPGIVALGEGEIATLSASLLVAFDTTVAGLATAVVAFVVSWLRRRWYTDYLSSMEILMNTLLGRAELLHEEDYDFEQVIIHYNKSGRKAQKQPFSVTNKISKERTKAAVKAHAAKRNQKSEGDLLEESAGATLLASKVGASPVSPVSPVSLNVSSGDPSTVSPIPWKKSSSPQASQASQAQASEAE